MSGGGCKHDGNETRGLFYQHVEKPHRSSYRTGIRM